MSPKIKMRLDKALTEQGLATSRTAAQGLILAGLVSVDGARVDKPGAQVGDNVHLSVQSPPHPYVSRGGLKLAEALEKFQVNPMGRIALDVGASTGGFTDLLLQREASHVFAVDVGYGQLDMRLRQDSRVTVLERENIRHLDPQKINQPVDLAVIDVSFISLARVLPKVTSLVKVGADIIALVKPQFEVGPKNVGKGGIVRDDSVRQRALDQVKETAENLGLEVIEDTPSPIKGAKGNVEFLLHLRKKQ